jgi:hypothetical protein
VALGFIRYFAVTDDSHTGRLAAGYLLSLLRIAPVRVVSKSGGLDGVWRRFEPLIMTPMVGTCVSCVCTHPISWIWESSVPMPEANVGAMGAATAATAPKVGGIARGISELYTPPRQTVLRNVLFVVDPPMTDAQRQTASRYEAVVLSPITNPWDDPARGDLLRAVGLRGWVAGVHEHAQIRDAVLGHSAASENTHTDRR